MTDENAKRKKKQTLVRRTLRFERNRHLYPRIISYQRGPTLPFNHWRLLGGALMHN